VLRRPGERIVLQEIWRGRLWAARPMTVVRDDGDLVALWFPQGTRWKAPTTPPTRRRAPTRAERFAESLTLGDWTFTDLVWDVSTLWLMRPGEWHAVWVSWLANGRHLGWYVNLQEPFRRSSLGFQTMDLMLDVIVERDRSWRWKDEDELDLLVARGVFDVQLARRLRAEALAVVARAQDGEPPFGEPWPSWHPDPTWSPPALPEDWQRI
jgi:Protein of unknown function (DUF402)